MEKVAFDSHSLVENYHHIKDHYIDDDNTEPLLGSIEFENGQYRYKNKGIQRHKISLAETRLQTNPADLEECNYPNSCPTINHTIVHFKENSEDDEEQTIKNIITEKGQFASYLQNRNMSKKNLKQFYILKKMSIDLFIMLLLF